MSASNGYQPCGCRDCMEIAIGEPGVLCPDCEGYCGPEFSTSSECQVERDDITEDMGTCMACGSTGPMGAPDPSPYGKCCANDPGPADVGCSL